MKPQKFWYALLFAFACIMLASLTFDARSAAGAPAALVKAPTATKRARATRTATSKPTRKPTRTATLAESTTTRTRTVSPTVPATATPTETPPSTETTTATTTAAPSETSTEIATVPDTETPTETATAAPSDTPVESATAESTETATETAVPSETPVLTETPTLSETPVPTDILTETPTSTATPTPTPDEDNSAFAVTPGAMNSTFLIANLDTTTANTTLRVFNSNGTPVYTLTRAIAPNGARAIPMPASVGDGFLGSATVSSLQKIAAIVLNANLRNSAREMYEGGTGSAALTFPLYRHLGNPAQKSVIAIQNTDPFASASVFFHFYNANGTEANGSPLTPVTIAPRASHYFDSQTIFASAVVTYSVSVTSTTSIAGAERFSYLRDTAAAAGIDPTQAGKQFYLNQVQRAGSDANPASWSEIYVRNTGTLSTTLTIRYFDHDGKLRTSETRALNANGMTVFDTRTKNKLGVAFFGYAILKQKGTQPLAVQWLEEDDQGRRLAAYSALPTNGSARQWACVDARHLSDAAQYTQFQVLNPGKNPAVVTLNLYDDTTGAKQLAQTYKLDGKQRRVIDLSDTPFNTLGGKYRGLAILRASRGDKVVVNAFENYSDKSETGYGCVSMP